MVDCILNDVIQEEIISSFLFDIRPKLNSASYVSNLINNSNNVVAVHNFV